MRDLSVPDDGDIKRRMDWVGVWVGFGKSKESKIQTLCDVSKFSDRKRDKLRDRVLY